MFNYARSDTHFLLFIYDQMKNELIDSSSEENNLIDAVLAKSKEEALRKYERSIYDAERGLGSNGWFNMIVRTPAIFTKQQFAVLRATHKWRDDVARKHDENVNTVMQKGAVYKIAMEMPVDIPKLLSCSHPVSAFLREHAQELVEVIKQAIATGDSGPEVKDLLKENHVDQRPISKPTGANGGASQPLPVFSVGPISVPARSTQSTFWGPTISNGEGSSIHSTGTFQSDLRLAVPLPPLTAEVFSSTNHASIEMTRAVSEPGSRAEHKYVKERKPVDDEIFTIREIAGARKRARTGQEDYSEQVPMQIPGLPPIPPYSEGNGTADELKLETSSTKLTRAERKALKRARKAQEASNTAGIAGDETQPEEAFDYTKAPSVLHAKPSQKDRASQKKPFDPYSKSLNAPKGMRKLDKEIAGKSYTFKN
jgi:exosome complex exonuclease RRP6